MNRSISRGVTRRKNPHHFISLGCVCCIAAVKLRMWANEGRVLQTSSTILANNTEADPRTPPRCVCSPANINAVCTPGWREAFATAEYSGSWEIGERAGGRLRSAGGAMAGACRFRSSMRQIPPKIPSQSLLRSPIHSLSVSKPYSA